ncbi:MAG: ComF family protein [Roseiflexus sp.]|nr:ComF family protein [Roseiflexus sp.]MCS7290843.1 ComF family protein [Roseiflexus sp.]MDW8146330.1 ComF family protein [Roseiflexaceae bacterium]
MSLALLLDSLLSLLLPDRCAGCGRLGALLCDECRHRLVVYDEALPRVADQLTGVRIAYVFEGPLRHALHQLKYRRRRRVARPLGTLMASHLHTHPLPCDALIPVPLHQKRLKERGFNQAELLAREVARATGFPLVVGPLVRIRATRQQALLGVAERIENVADAFVWKGPAPPARIVLVDDVLTTGATVNACAAALRAGGAREVYALALARSRGHMP